MFNALRNVLRDDEGATMVEYAIMVALIAAVCIGVVTALGKSVSSAFSKRQRFVISNGCCRRLACARKAHTRVTVK